MSSPDPLPPLTPAPLTATQAAMPTLGATIGSALGALLSAKLGAADPLLGHTVVLVTTTLVTALFHWVGTKLGGLTL